MTPAVPMLAPEPDNYVVGKIGPSIYFIPGSMLLSPISWAGALLTAFRFSADFRTSLWKLAHLVGAHDALIRFWTWDKGLVVPLWLCVLLVALLFGVIRYLTSSYEICADGNFIINTGLLGLRTPRGPLIEYQNTIAMSLIADCDVSRNPIQLLFGTGTLVITFCELNQSVTRKGAHTIFLPYIARPEACRDTLMAASQVKNARFIV